MSKNDKRIINIQTGIYNEQPNQGIQAGRDLINQRKFDLTDLKEVISLIESIKNDLRQTKDINPSDSLKIDKDLEKAKNVLKEAKPDTKRALNYMKNAAAILKHTTTLAASTTKLIPLVEKVISWLKTFV